MIGDAGFSDAKSDAYFKSAASTVLGYYVPVAGWIYSAVSATEGVKTAKKGAQAGINHNQATIARIKIEKLKLDQQKKMVQDLATMQAAVDAAEADNAAKWRKYLTVGAGLAILLVGVLYLTRREKQPPKS